MLCNKLLSNTLLTPSLKSSAFINKLPSVEPPTNSTLTSLINLAKRLTLTVLFTTPKLTQKPSPLTLTRAATALVSPIVQAVAVVTAALGPVPALLAQAGALVGQALLPPLQVLQAPPRAPPLQAAALQSRNTLPYPALQSLPALLIVQ